MLPVVLLATGAFAQERLTLAPEAPKVGEAFQVALVPAPEMPAAGQFEWKVTVLDEEKNDITGTAAPAMLPDAPTLKMPAAQAKASYIFKLKTKTPSKEYSLTAESGGTRLRQTGSAEKPLSEGQIETPPAAPMAPSLELKKMGERLEAAKSWAKQTAVLPKSESLVLPVTFFQDKLAKRPDGKEGITEFAQRPILDAVELHRAMMAVANQFPADTDPDRFIEAWHDQKKEFLKVLPERNAATALIVELWKEFTDVWELEVLKENKARFREALVQAPLVVLGILLEFDEQHIKAAMTGGPPAGTQGGGTSAYGGGIYTHAAVHHVRAMSRIHYRHRRQMARLGY